MDRDYAGSMTKYLVDYFRLRGRPGALEEVLARAGETRSPDDLADECTWSSYAQLRALLEAAAEVLGSTSHLAAVAASSMESLSSPDFTAILQDLGSPSVLYASISDAAATMTSIMEMTAEEAGPTEWVLTNRFTDGFEPFPEYCSFGAGLISVPPMLFGLPPADVVEEECQARGAPACRYRVTWTPHDEPATRADYLAVKAEVAEARLRALQSTAADIVSGEELGDVLARIVHWTSRAVRASGYVLAVDAPPLGGHWVHTDGLSAAERADAVARVEGDSGPDPRLCAVKVVSERAVYGVLVAVNENGRHLFPQEVAVLESHARLAAAALDSATALHDARRQAETATALLQLSSSLAHLAGVGEMADRVARALPDVLNCDRASVVLIDAADPGTLRFAGVWGYPPEQEAAMRSGVFEGYAPDMPDVVDLWDLRDIEDPDLRAHMEASGSVAAARIPIFINGEAGGALLASVTERPERLLANPALGEILRGVAAQAGTAIHNARLLDRVQHQALHDALTGLPNRALILDRAAQMLSRARRDGEPVAALFVDLDHFKDINDSMGHEAGDTVLRAVAERFTSCLRSSDTVGRLGGDEFLILAGPTALAEGPDRIADRLFAALREPFSIGVGRGTSLFVTASIGVAVADQGSADELLRMADIALYQAKAAGRSCHAVFAPEMESEVLRRVELELELRAALDNGEFVLDYQPIFRLADGRMTGAEALIRWRHPERGVVPPMEFIPVLEETGLIGEVGRWVLHSACAQAAAWKQAGHPIGMAVNVSVRQLCSLSLVDDVRSALDQSGLEPEWLTLEITETALMSDTSDAVAGLAALRALGVHVAVDDFGIGYSSFSYLRTFPVECLKIDRTFVGDSDTEDGRALVRMMLGMGRTLGLAPVAEGIENAEQLAWLQAEGCMYGQGYHLARPMPADALLEMLESPAATRR